MLIGGAANDKVNIEDAKIAIDLMKYYLMQVGYDYESKTFDIDRITTGIGSSQRNKIILVRQKIVELEDKLGKLIPVEEIEKALENKITATELEEAITQLSKSGDIFKPKKGFIQKTSNRS